MKILFKINRQIPDQHIYMLLKLIFIQARRNDWDKFYQNILPERIVLELTIAAGKRLTEKVIVQEGKNGDYLICDTYYFKVKSIIDDHGKKI